MHLIGVLLAAGRSQRMGELKQLMPWPPVESVGGLSETDNATRTHAISASETPPTEPAKPLVAAAFDAIAPACCAMVVVVGHEADLVLGALGERTFQSVRVSPDAEMIASIKAGLSAAVAIHPTADVLLQPADHPEVRRETIEQLLRTSAEQAGRAVVPEHDGRGGHPVVIPAELVYSILDFAGAGGLRQFWLDHPDDCVRLSVDDPGVMLDLDVPSDYGAGV